MNLVVSDTGPVRYLILCGGIEMLPVNLRIGPEVVREILARDALRRRIAE